MDLLKKIPEDARHFQILTLSSLLLFLMVWSDFPTEPFVIVLIVSATLITQFLFFKFLKIRVKKYHSKVCLS